VCESARCVSVDPERLHNGVHTSARCPAPLLPRGEEPVTWATIAGRAVCVCVCVCVRESEKGSGGGVSQKHYAITAWVNQSSGVRGPECLAHSEGFAGNQWERETPSEIWLAVGEREKGRGGGNKQNEGRVGRWWRKVKGVIYSTGKTVVTWWMGLCE